MNKTLKAKWVEALRSGKYAQEKGNLRFAGKYCCLGVLCDVMGAEWRDESTPWLNDECLEANGESYLSGPALRLAGMEKATQKQLANMNDDGISFKEIADYIDKRL